MAVKTANLLNLQRQLNEAFPNRTLPDGWIGNEAHRLHTSGHNPDDTAGSKPAWDGDPDNVPEVRALDVPADLGDGVTGADIANHLRRMASVLGAVIRYFIHDGYIYRASAGFQPQVYTGDNPHREHLHMEGAWTQVADNNATFDFRFREVPVALTTADKTWIKGTIEAAVKAAVDDFLTVKINDKANPGRTVQDRLCDDAKIRGVWVGDPKDTANAAVPADAPLMRVIAAADKILAADTSTPPPPAG